MGLSQISGPVRKIARNHLPHRTVASYLALVAIAGLVAACTPRVDTHGERIEADRLAQVRPGVQTRDQVAQYLGSPASTSLFGDETWYYISDTVETRSIFDRDVTERQVITIRFDQAGIVKEVDLFGLERGTEVEMVERETPSFGESENFFNQLVGNLGRFNREQTPPQR